VKRCSVFFGLSGVAGFAFAGDHDVLDTDLVQVVVDFLPSR